MKWHEAVPETTTQWTDKKVLWNLGDKIGNQWHDQTNECCNVHHSDHLEKQTSKKQKDIQLTARREPRRGKRTRRQTRTKTIQTRRRRSEKFSHGIALMEKPSLLEKSWSCWSTRVRMRTQFEGRRRTRNWFEWRIMLKSRREGVHKENKRWKTESGCLETILESSRKFYTCFLCCFGFAWSQDDPLVSPSSLFCWLLDFNDSWNINRCIPVTPVLSSLFWFSFFSLLVAPFCAKEERSRQILVTISFVPFLLIFVLFVSHRSSSFLLFFLHSFWSILVAVLVYLQFFAQRLPLFVSLDLSLLMSASFNGFLDDSLGWFFSLLLSLLSFRFSSPSRGLARISAPPLLLSLSLVIYSGRIYFIFLSSSSFFNLLSLVLLLSPLSFFFYHFISSRLQSHVGGCISPYFRSLSLIVPCYLFQVYLFSLLVLLSTTLVFSLLFPVFDHWPQLPHWFVIFTSLSVSSLF